jgi:hypothetical protein
VPTLNLKDAERKREKRMSEKSILDEASLSQAMQLINTALAVGVSGGSSPNYEYHSAVFCHYTKKKNNSNLAKLVISEIKILNDEEGDKFEIKNEVSFIFILLFHILY